VTEQGASAHGLNLVAASAGSGKTHRLTQEVVNAVDPSNGASISPFAIVAITYTRKAAAELAGRIRQKLIRCGAHNQAQALPRAYLGTVHAICLRLVQEYALDIGLSPAVDVLAGHERLLLRQALEESLDVNLREKLEDLARKLQVRWIERLTRSDWLLHVEDIMTLARSNRIHPSTLPAMALRSADGLLAVLGAPTADGDALDRELASALRASSKALVAIDDGQKGTQKVRELVNDAYRDAQRARVAWSDWVRLQNLRPGKTAQQAVHHLREVASRMESHPRLQAELRELVLGIYEAARQGLEGYDGWKRRRRVVDFVDMLEQGLTLVEQPDVAADLKKRLAFVVVDEFQDTSPIQLALFVRLHQLVGRSVWVGDRKQCIFEFAGADPTLMEAVRVWVAAARGAADTLKTNYRSRPELVDACSQLFSRAFARHGYEPGEVVVGAHRPIPPEVANLPPLGLWWLASSKLDEDAEALANGVSRLLETPAATPIVDPTSKLVRPVGAGDIAVLVATNDEATRLAGALSRRGVSASVARDGLLATPEGTLLRAALGLLLDSEDSLSRVTVEALAGGGAPDAWLHERLALVNGRDANELEAVVAPAVPTTIGRIAALSAEIDRLSPSEMVDRVLSALDFATLCNRWPEPVQRMGNIDALRGLCRAYEERCTNAHAAGTLAGLLRFFDEIAERVFVRDEERGADYQHIGGSDASVVVTTYHRAKGLEWPVVILASLYRTARRDAFDVSPESDQPGFDATEPLAGRWIRCWPRICSTQTTTLVESAAASPVGRAVAEREERERARLLYVGFTRARDHLILAARQKEDAPAAVQWLDELRDAEGMPLLDLPNTVDPSGKAQLRIREANGNGMHLPARHWRLSAEAIARTATPTDEDRRWFAHSTTAPLPRKPYRIVASRAGGDWTELGASRAGEIHSIGEALALRNSGTVAWDVLGNAFHAFFAADSSELATAARIECATLQVEAAELTNVIEPAWLVRAGDQLRAWIARRWPVARWLREYPVSATIQTSDGARRVDGTIDLLLETPDGVVLIDHKTFPGTRAAWAEKVGEHGAQLNAYARILEMAGLTVLGKWLHFPIGAGVIQVLDAIDANALPDSNDDLATNSVLRTRSGGDNEDRKP